MLNKFHWFEATWQMKLMLNICKQQFASLKFHSINFFLINSLWLKALSLCGAMMEELILQSTRFAIGLSTIARERLKRFTMRIKEGRIDKVLSICRKLISRLFWLINYVGLWNEKKICTISRDRFRSFSAKIHSNKRENIVWKSSPFEVQWYFLLNCGPTFRVFMKFYHCHACAASSFGRQCCLLWSLRNWSFIEFGYWLSAVLWWSFVFERDSRNLTSFGGFFSWHSLSFIFPPS